MSVFHFLSYVNMPGLVVVRRFVYKLWGCCVKFIAMRMLLCEVYCYGDVVATYLFLLFLL